jgi:D-amino-acid oxidase
MITVIGAGISGLTTAIVLLEAGYEVQIFTDKLPGKTTSAVAAAIWLPYEVQPKEKVNHWSLRSYKRFETLCNRPESGVSMVDLTTLIQIEDDAWWKDALPPGKIRKASAAELPEKFPLGYILIVPMIETPIYLAYMLRQFQEAGGVITKQKADSLAPFTTDDNIVVNCAGLGSRELVQDKSMYPIQGQIVKAMPQVDAKYIVAEFTFGEARTELAYVFPRKDCLVLGGTAVKGAGSTEPDPLVSEGIVKRCQAIHPDLPLTGIKNTVVGLRPGRPEIRLEREGNIIHNYGHGGGGFTVSWGCAEEVKSLIHL